jgi:hypothetical protein
MATNMPVNGFLYTRVARDSPPGRAAVTQQNIKGVPS